MKTNENVAEPQLLRTTVPLEASIRSGVADWVLLFAGLCAAGHGVWNLLAGDPTRGATSLGVALVLLLAANIERFEYLKGLGIEAKTRQLDGKLREAQDILSKLRDLTETVCPMLVQITSVNDRFGGYQSQQDKYAFARSTARLLDAQGSSPDVIRAALLPWARTIAFDVTQSFMHGVLHRAKLNSESPEATAALATLQDGAEARCFQWPLDRFPRWLESQASKDFGLGENEARDVRAQAAKWVAELEWLDTHLDLRDKAAWFEQADKPR